MALALGSAGSALATVRAFHIWMSARAYPRVLRASGSHHFTVDVAIQNRRSSIARLSLELDARNLVFDGRRMVYEYSFGPVTVRPPTVGRSYRLPAPSDLPMFMCYPNDAVSVIFVDLKMPAHTRTTLRFQLTAAFPYWLPNPFTPFVPHGHYTFVAPDMSWNSSFANQATEIPVAPVRLVGPPGEEIVFNGPGDPVGGAVGAPLAIGGTTNPPAPRRLIVLTARRWLGHSRWRTVPVGIVRTDGLGYFNYNWVPTRPGNYQIVGRMAHPPRGILPDGACGQIAQVVAR